MTARLPAWSLFAALIAMAGLPIYIHAPKFFVDSYGISLASLGLTLAALRLIDVVQDPLLGWLAEATRPRRRLTIAVASTLMAAALWGLQPLAYAPFAAHPGLRWLGLAALVAGGMATYALAATALGVLKPRDLLARLRARR